MLFLKDYSSARNQHSGNFNPSNARDIYFILCQPFISAYCNVHIVCQLSRLKTSEIVALDGSQQTFLKPEMHALIFSFFSFFP